MVRAKVGAFTLIELMVVVAIIAVLIAILLPSLNRARQQAYQVKCAANLRNIGLGIFYYVDDQHGFLPFRTGVNDIGGRGEVGYAPWVSALLPYIKIKHGKVGSRDGLFRCPADADPFLLYLTIPDSGRDPTPPTTRGRDVVGNAAPQRPLRPLIEPVSYAVAVSEHNRTSHTLIGIPPPRDGLSMPRKLSELDRPYCQTLLGEIFSHCFGWEWGVQRGWDNAPRVGRVTGREAWRHYGGTNPNSNGSNWLFADGHVQWHSVASLEKLFCCQDFPRGTSVYEYQAQRCGGGATTRRR